VTLHVHLDRGVCELRLDAPPGNVIDRACCAQLAAAVREHAGNPAIRALLLTAAGRHFSYGASVPEHVRGEVETFLPVFHDALLAVADAGVPVLSAVHGLCLGGAFELVAAGTFILAEETAVLGVPEIQLGVLPPAACIVLPWRAGGAAAEDLILTGRRIAAAEAKALGLVNRVVPAGELAAATAEFLDEHVRSRSGAVLRLAARAARAPLVRELRARLPELERTYLRDLMATRDAGEGLRAFLEKRSPAWSDA